MKVFTTTQAGVVCKLSRKVVVRLFDQGHIKGHRLPYGGDPYGGDRRILLEHLLQFMKKNNIPLDGLRGDPDAEEILIGESIDALDNKVHSLVREGKLLPCICGVLDCILDSTLLEHQEKTIEVMQEAVSLMERQVALKKSAE